jgi:hypothetical protein
MGSVILTLAIGAAGGAVRAQDVAPGPVALRGPERREEPAQPVARTGSTEQGPTPPDTRAGDLNAPLDKQQGVGAERSR